MQFTLRPWHENDLESLLRYANNAAIAKFMTNKFPHPYTSEAGKAFIAFATAHTPIHIFAIDINGEAVGGIGVHPQDDVFEKNAEMGYWLAQPFWGNGIITRAIPQIIDFAFATYPINRLFARPFESNIASQKVLEKNGFVLEARFENTIFKNGVFENELVYAVRR